MPEALAARQRAVDAYLAYRRDCGESTTPRAQWFAMVAQQPAAAREPLTALRQQPKLIPEVDNPDITYADAAELLLLIAHLTAASHAAPRVLTRGLGDCRILKEGISVP